MSRIIFIFFGPPGSGKGTQSDLLGEKLGWPVISTGELLRWHLHHQTAIGQKAKKYMDAGKLVPDKVVEELVAHRLSKPDTKQGVIFDGYPRDAKQLKNLLATFKKSDIVWPIEIKLHDKEVINRLAGRRVCDCGASYHIVYQPTKVPGICDLCGKKIYTREDDKPKVIRERLTSYKKSSRPLMDYAQEIGRLLSFNSDQPIKAVKAEVWKEVSLILSSRRRGSK